MVALDQHHLAARKFMAGDFSQAFPNGFRALQDMAVAGSKAYKNNGKRAWFGFGRDLSLESMRQYQDSVMLLVIALSNDGFINLPAADGIPEDEQIDRVVSMFFTAYPNWPDAEAAWGVIGRRAMNAALGNISY